MREVFISSVLEMSCENLYRRVNVGITFSEEKTDFMLREGQVRVRE